ncbi:aminopeptidase 2 [Capsaspora owczarzaki ATCC 30864]|uniref:Aminopeptidase n=1 Tax=Capsaspora owczarzaki (strain ATCC 30864) TaxID=595528 RepID=A0A0D2WQP4_CAPO3|nr:aminopeptidase 2 [Capsaspora owczarzaki ATCC 30864]KJE94030.1 aminopeptidase 2 [Capsaspora owczarzaki ATCC 30864]|eukprot:XP_004347477.1 aminopeptidase 2 [Capsaspora owczarzaki ATCC 30864]
MTSVNPTSSESSSSSSSRVLLPTTFKPSHYDLWLELPAGLTSGATTAYDGRVAIDLAFNGDSAAAAAADAAAAETVLVLHAIDLTIASASLQLDGADDRIQASATSVDATAETCSLTFPIAASKLAKAKKIVAHAAFSGTLNDNLVGLYRSSYEMGGEKRYMATTQFEATDARRCFPCFDEPALKASFAVTLVVPENLVAVSNMPVEEERIVRATEAAAGSNANKKLVRFQTSVVMSTYLLAFVVGELEFIEARTKEGIPVRCYTTPGKKQQAAFSLRVAVESLSFYGEYFGMPYPLPKLDMLAIPDFAAGAMENFGCVTYREIAILIDDASSSVSSKENVAITVAHELGHMWFGNIVTMEWWTDLWLNEGFASWISYFAVDRQFPEWQLWTQFVNHDYASALKLDALLSSHPIEVEVKTSGEINEIFDAISYSKGSSVIRMLEAYLGPTDFCNGLRLYMKRHRFGNAKTADLWKALAEASGKPVEQVMNLYTKHTGYPLLSLVELTKEGDEQRSFTLSQQRFLLDDSPAAASAEASPIWWIPVSIKSNGLEQPMNFAVTSQVHSFTLPASVKPHHWIKLNAEQTGLYRVHYPTAHMTALAAHVASTAKLSASELAAIPSAALVTASDRLGIVSDIFAIAKRGIIRTSDALEFGRFFVDETNYNVWAELISNMSEVAAIWANTDAQTYAALSAFILRIVSPLAKRCGYFDVPEKGEDHMQSLLRALAVRTAGYFGDTAVVERARQSFAAFLANPKALHPDLRSTVYSIVAKWGTEAEFESLIKLYETAELHEEKVRVLGNIAHVSDPKLIERVLAYSLSDRVRTQDCIFPFRAFAGNRHASGLVWQFVQGRWEELDKRFSQGNMNMIGSFINSAAAGFASHAKADEVAAFFKTRPVPSAERTIKQAIERIHARANVLDRDRAVMAEYLAKF